MNAVDPVFALAVEVVQAREDYFMALMNNQPSTTRKYVYDQLRKALSEAVGHNRVKLMQLIAAAEEWEL